MSWLSEIENRLKAYGSIEGNLAVLEKERMARVIRELAPRTKAYEWITDNMPSDEIFDGLVGADIIIEDYLSPDAKELLK